jgi:hypothetical protein
MTLGKSLSLCICLFLHITVRVVVAQCPQEQSHERTGTPGFSRFSFVAKNQHKILVNSCVSGPAGEKNARLILDTGTNHTILSSETVTSLALQFLYPRPLLQGPSGLAAQRDSVFDLQAIWVNGHISEYRVMKRTRERMVF